MGVFGKRLSVVLISILMATSFSNSAFAELKVDDFIDEWSQNEIMYYNPAECVDGANDSNKTCISPTGDQITWIGDSYSVGAKSIIESKFSGISFGDGVDGPSSYIQVGKTVGGSNAENPSGFTILQGIINEGGLKPYLVFALGTNDSWDNGKVEQFNSIMAGHDDTQVVLVNSKTLNNDYAASNATLSAMVEAHSNYHLADWVAVAKNEYYANDREGIHPVTGYAAWVDVIKEALPKNCSGELCGSNAREKYWSALSNHFGPAAAAGIMGNIDNEGGYSPTMMEQTYLKAYDLGSKTWVNGWNWDSYFNSDDRPTGLGAFQITSGRASYLHHINDTEPGLIKYFKDPGTYSISDGDALIALIGEEDFDKMVGLEVEWMYKMMEEDQFVDLEVFRNLGDAGEAAKYFLIHYERPADQSEAMQQKRAEAGRKAYEELKNFTCSNGSTNTTFTTTEDLSSAANAKYDATEEQKAKLLKFAVWEASKSGDDYRDVLSTILDDYERAGQGEKGKTDGLIKYVEESEKFKYRSDYDNYKTLSANVTITAEQEEVAQDIINRGLRTTSAGKAEITNAKKRETNYCPDENGKKGKGAAQIAETAALMAWPVQSWQTSADDFKSDRVGKCYNDFDNESKDQWITYAGTQSCANTPRKLYKEALNTNCRLDCGLFSLSVLKYLGLIDDNFFWGGQPGAGGNFRKHPGEWKEITVNSESDLKPGDVLWNSGHIMIYVGEEYGGEYGVVAHASVGCAGGCQCPGEGGRVGQIGSSDGLTNYTAFRYIGDKLGEGQVDEDGLTYEQAKQLVMNYGANKNNSSYNVVPGLWYIDEWGCATGGSNCVTFSAWFENKFTSMRHTSGWGNGDQFVETAVSGFKTGTEPKVWAIFSADPIHTGVILGKDGDEWIVGHAGYSHNGCGVGDGTEAGGGSGLIIKSSNIVTAAWGAVPHLYAYPDTIDYDAIMKYLETGE